MARSFKRKGKVAGVETRERWLMQTTQFSESFYTLQLCVKRMHGLGDAG